MTYQLKRATNIFNSFCLFFKIMRSNSYLEDEKNILSFKETMIKSGPIYIKFCQLISQRDDTFNCNIKLKKHLNELQEKCNIHDFSETTKIFKLNFPNTTLEETFDYINPIPIASGSISQIYQVILKNEDTFSVMKIKHPNIEKQIKENIIEFKFIIELFKKANYKFLDSINFEHFFDCVLLQLNYKHEVEITKEFNEKIEDLDYISCPKIINYSKDIIIETFEEGVSYNNFIQKFPDLEIECKIKALHCFFYMIFVLRLSHVDCHNGNILYSIKNNKIKISFIDFGVSCKLCKEDRDAIGNLLKSVNNRNKNLFFESLLKCCNNDIKLELVLDNLKDFDLNIFFSVKNNNSSLSMIKDALIILRNVGIIINCNILDVLINMSLIVESLDNKIEYTIFDYTIYDIMENDKTKLKDIFEKIIDIDSYYLKKNLYKKVKYI